MKIQFPETKIQVADIVCQKCGTPTIRNEENKCLANLKGIINRHIIQKKMGVMDAVDNFGEIWDAIKLAQTSNGLAILPESLYNRMLEIVKVTESWGDLEAQRDLFNAFRQAEKAEKKE